MVKSIILSALSLILAAACGDPNSGNAADATHNASPTKGSNPANTIEQNDEVSAATPAFRKEFTQHFPGFDSLAPGVLEKVVTTIPPQKTLWGCGLHQSEAAIDIAYLNQRKQRPDKTDFMKVGDYPLALDVNLKKYSESGAADLITSVAIAVVLNDEKLLKGNTDEEGNFRVGALPQELAKYINKKIPKPSQVRAEAISQDSLTAQNLLDTVKHNLELHMPTPVYYVVNADKSLLHVLSIVGVKGDDLLILDTQKNGVDRFYSEAVSTFVANMNTESLFKKIQSYEGFRSLIEKAGGHAASKEEIAKAKAYNLIKFVKTN